MQDNVLAVCDAGCTFELENFEPPREVIAHISWCPNMVSKKDSLLVTECGARVLWKKLNLLTDNLRRKWRFRRNAQLDLFYDSP